MSRDKPSRSFFRLSYFVNKMSATGFLMAFGAGFFHLSLMFIDLFRGTHNPYMNIWLYLVLPPVVFVGFALAFLGASRQRRRLLNAGAGEVKKIDTEGVRKTFFAATVIVAILLVPFIAVTSYEGYSYTDSVEFCGKVCHQVMSPAYTAYQKSPHARVACSACHIGEGASWFVRSKLSGTRQVFATMFDTYHRPIGTPLVDLRPARETCERCHWPDKAHGDRVVELPHFASNENNTNRPLTMVLHTGGGDSDIRPLTGIHWHVSKAHEIEYVASDTQRQVIPWIKMTTEEGVRIFRSDGLPHDSSPPEGERRTMDCIDCHNRPSHKYRPPDAILNHLFAEGLLDRSLPYFKREAARLMAAHHEDTPSAAIDIAEGLHGFYEEKYPHIATERRNDIEAGIDVVVEAFENNLFPEMKTDWRVHPDHIGHKYWPGCFRCHNDEQRDAGGKVIGKDCKTCHDFMEHQEVKGVVALVHGDYNHPFPLEGAHASLDCHLCHTGGPTPPATCDGCHFEIRDFIAGVRPILDGVKGTPDSMLGSVECVDCHDEPRPIAEEEIVPLCVFCHEEEYTPTAENLLRDLEVAARRAADALRTKGRSSPRTAAMEEALELVERLRPVHNADYAFAVYRALSGDGANQGESKKATDE